ncbi:YfiR family protein [Kiritimatiella glycovorans]|nr:YfiR family protein [Kiritimatiella glycovorans]
MKRGGAVLMLLIGMVTPSPAQPETKAVSREYQVKAAFLYNFLLYVEWPETCFKDEQTPFRLMVCGEDPFGAVLIRAAERGVKQRPLRILHGRQRPEGSRVHAVFIARSEAVRMETLLEEFGRRGVLTVSDAPGFVLRGGMIELVVREGKVRFLVNREAAEHADLEFSSHLLRLAMEVRP